jgi:hypothetical protein
MAYRAYYDALNLSPEDVGVDTAYVLVRSPGFVLMTIGAAFLAYWGIGSFESYLAKPEKLLEPGSRFAFPRFVVWFLISLGAWVFSIFCLLTFYVVQFYGDMENLAASSQGNRMFGTLFIILSIIFATIRIVPDLLSKVAPNRINSLNVGRVARYLQVGLALVITVLLPAVLVVGRAESLGHRAASGDSVRPVQVFGIVILDVSAVPVDLVWSDPKTPHPPYFGSTAVSVPVSGTLLGQTENSIVANVSYAGRFRIVRFDARQVIVEYKEDVR